MLFHILVLLFHNFFEPNRCFILQMNSDICEGFIGPNYSWTFQMQLSTFIGETEEGYYTQEAIVPIWAVVHLQKLWFSTENVIREGKKIQF